MNEHPLIAGFKQGIAGHRLTPSEPVKEPTTCHMTATAPQIDIAERAAFYKVTTRTIYRWIAAGVRVEDPFEVGVHIVSLKHSPPDTIEAVLSELEETA